MNRSAWGNWRRGSPAGVLVLAASLAACGGGGGDDDGSFTDDSGILLDSYNFAVTNPAGAPGPLTRTYINQGLTDVYTVNAGTGTIRGSYSLVSGDFTVADTTTFTVTWSGEGPIPADFSVGVTEAVNFRSGTFQPSTGAFAVTWGTDTITVEYGATTSIALNGGAPQAFPPQEFINLDEPGPTTAPDWHRVAARASQVLVDVLGQARGIADVLESINDGALDSGTRVTSCQLIPGVPPGGIMPQGEIVATDLGAGDYRAVADDCFTRSTSSSTTGIFRTGTVDYANLVSTLDANDVVIRAGFEGSAQDPGGVDFDTRLQFMGENGVGNWNFQGIEILYDGGFSIVFTAP